MQCYSFEVPNNEDVDGGKDKTVTPLVELLDVEKD